MKLRLFVPVAAVAVLGVVGPASTVAAVPVPDGPMDFQVEIDQESLRAGAEPDCTPSPLEIGQAVMTTGSAEISCKVVMKQTAAPMSGSVSNATLAEEDEGFNDGSLAMTCNVDQEVTTKMKISRSSVDMTSFTGKTAQACAWKMTFADAKSSTLAGTMEINGNLGNDDGSVEDDSVSITVALTVYMTQGTGAFAGYTGGGDFTRTEVIDLNLPEMPGGGSETPTSVPAGDGLQAFCTQEGITPCNSEKIQQFCVANPTKCQTRTSSQSVRASGVSTNSVRSFADSSSMSLTLKKSAGAVRIISPSAPTGQPNVAATVTKSTRIQIVATKGANCQVKTNRGRVVASKRITTDGTTTLRPKSGSMKGAKSIRAFCKIGKKSISSNVVKIKST